MSVPRTGTVVPISGTAQVTNFDAAEEEFARYAEANQRRRGPMCAVCRLSQEEKDRIQRWARSKPMSLISGFLKSKGTLIQANTLTRHFREGHADGE